MNNLILKIIELSKNNNEEKIETIIEEKLKQEPNSIELLLRLAVLELTPPIADYYKSIASLEKILILEKNNVIATLLLAYINHYCLGGVDKTLKDKLSSLHTNCDELNSMLKYAASWFYSGKDIKLEEQLLIESINLYKGHVWNYVHLAKLYFLEGRSEEGRALIKRALKKVTKVYSGDNQIYDIINVNEFLNEHIKGIYLTKENLELIQKLK